MFSFSSLQRLDRIPTAMSVSKSRFLTQSLGNICVRKSASRDTNVGQYSYSKKCFEGHKCWAIFVLKKVLRGTQMLGNIRIQKSASRDTNVGQYSC